MGHRTRAGRRANPAKAVQGFLWHAGAFAITAFTVDLSTAAMAWWGLAVAMHGVSTIPALVAGVRSRRAGAAGAPAAQLPSGDAAAPAPAAVDPFLGELDRALGALEAASRGRTLPAGLDLAALRREAAALRERHLSLAALAAPEPRDRLAAERTEALARAEAAQDPRTAEVLRAQARSVGERLEGLSEAAGAAARLEARERTLLHQLEALRLSLVQAGVEEGRAPDLAAEVRSIQLDVKATAEVESELARARLGAARRQPT
jgi:hypothetical protein